MVYLPYNLSGAFDGTVRIWDARTGQQIEPQLRGYVGGSTSLACSPDGRYICCGFSWGACCMWDMQSGQMMGWIQLQSTDSMVASIRYSPDGAFIATVSSSGHVLIWERQIEQDVKYVFESHIQTINSVAYSPDGMNIASGSMDMTVHIWDVASGRMVGKPLIGHTSGVLSIAYSPDGAYIASSSLDGTICIWNARTSEMVGQPLKDHTDSVLCVAYSPAGDYLVSGSRDGSLCIRNRRTGTVVGQPLRGHTDTVSCVAYSPDGAYLASGSYDGTIRIWDAHTRQPVGQPLVNSDVHSSANYVTSLAYSPDGSCVTSAYNSHTVCVWSVQTRKRTRFPLRGKSVAYSSDGVHMASVASAFSTLRIHDLQTSRELPRPWMPWIGISTFISSFAFSPDGAYIATASIDNVIRVWDIAAIRWLEKPSDMSSPRSLGETRARISDQAFDTYSGVGRASSPICNSEYQRDSSHETWEPDDHGWVVVNDTKLLICVPEDLKDLLLLPQHTTIASSPSGFLQLKFDHNMIGEHWAQHFQPLKPGQLQFT